MGLINAGTRVLRHFERLIMAKLNIEPSRTARVSLKIRHEVFHIGRYAGTQVELFES